MTTTAVIRLLSRPKIPMSMRLGPEDRESVVLADALRVASLEGRLKGTWTKVANEGKRHRLTALLLRAMGMHTGAPDFVFVWAGGGGWLELKVGRNKPTQSQFDFAAWCAFEGVRHAVVWSAAEAFEVLQDWGALLPPRATGPAGAMRVRTKVEAA